MALELSSSGVSLTDLVAYYKMETGAITTDSSGNSKTLTNNGTVTATTGLFGDCIDLGTANSSKYLSRADGLGIDLSGAFSTNTWIKLRTEPSTDTADEVLRWSSTTGTSRYISVYYQDISGNKRLVANNSEGYATFNAGLDSILGVTNWHMITVVATGTVVTLYLDGQSVATATRGSTTTAQNLVRIGADNISGQYINAYIDDTSFWSRALTDAEIATLYDLVPSSIILV